MPRSSCTNDPTTSRPSASLTVPWDHPRRIDGLELRYLLTDLIDGPERRVWSVSELVETVAGLGFRFGDRPSRAVSDLLRLEIWRGRIVRLGRGRYRAAVIPGSTRRRIRKHAYAQRVAIERVAWAELAPGSE